MLWMLARYFLYLGATGFGGPLVLIQLMRQHFVTENKKITAEEFDQTFALVKAMPGPVAFQMAVFLGQRFSGLAGGSIAGFCLLLPAFIMMVLAGYFYTSLVAVQSVQTIMSGLLYAASAVIILSLKNLVISQKNNFIFWIFLVLNLPLFYYHLLPEPFLIIFFGALAVFINNFKKTNSLASVAFLFFDFDKIIQILKTCTYAGAFVFGTGFALIPVLKSNLVDLHQLISFKEFNDGVVFGQMTPGPITITATFIGYQISGIAGALAATIGVFLLPFIHMVTWFPKAIAWMSRQKWIAQFIGGATAAVVAGILITVLQMNRESMIHIKFWITFLCTGLYLIYKPKTSVLVIFIIAGLTHYLLALIQ